MLIPMTWQWLAGHILITRCSVFANVWRWKGAEINLYLPHPSRFHSTNKGETNELENVKTYLLMYLSCFFWSKNIKAQIVLYSSILFLKMFSKLGIHLGAGIIHLCLLILGLSQNNMNGCVSIKWTQNQSTLLWEIMFPTTFPNKEPSLQWCVCLVVNEAARSWTKRNCQCQPLVRFVSLLTRPWYLQVCDWATPPNCQAEAHPNTSQLLFSSSKVLLSSVSLF